MRDYQIQRLGGSGGSGNHGERRGAPPPQIRVRQVEQFLIVRVGVNGGHRPAGNSKLIDHHFGIGARQFVVQEAFETT